MKLRDGMKEKPAAFDTPGRIEALQARLLREHAAYAAAYSPFYRELFRRLGVEPAAIRTPADLALLPLTEKSDLDAHNGDFLAAPGEIADVCLTSATTGDRPTALMQTRSDLDRLALNEYLAFSTAGLGAGDTIYVAAALDRCFMAGLAYFLGALRLGARAVRGGSGSAAQHWHMLKTIAECGMPNAEGGINAPRIAMVGVPSLMRRIAEQALENGEDPRAIGVKKLLAIGEPTRDADLKLLPAAAAAEELWGAEIYSTYASTEQATTFCECPERCGGHLQPELIILEILDEAGKPCPAGVAGEVVVTPLGVRGMPLLRFRTGDVACGLEGPCECGRNAPRIGPILGRRNQMLKFKGTTVFPTAILAAVEGRPGVAGACVEARRNPDGTDRVVVQVALGEGGMTVARLKEEIQARVRVTPEIEVLGEAELNAKINREDKRKRVVFFDLR